MIRLVRWTGSRWHLIRDGATTDLAGFPHDLTVRYESHELPSSRLDADEFFAARAGLRQRMCGVCVRAAIRQGLISSSAVPEAMPARPTTTRRVSEIAIESSIQPQDRTFGVEIECISPFDRYTTAARLHQAGIDCFEEGYNHTTADHWKIVTDGSVHGRGTPMEVVSPKLRGEDGVNEVKAVCRVLHELGVTVNTSCGLHVHHDARDFANTPRAFVRAAKFYATFESVFDSFMPASRRENHNSYCRTMRHFDLDALDRSATTISDLRRTFYDRYHKVNISAYWRHGTVEFRHHSGTINGSKIASWVKLTNAIMKWAIGSDGFPVTTGDAAQDRAAMFAALRLEDSVANRMTRRATSLATRIA